MLAERISYRFIDNEDLFFPKEDPSYMYANPRSKDEVIQLLEATIAQDRHYVFAAVKGDYGEIFISSLEHIILIDVPKHIRLQRIRDRSFRKFGERILLGGDLYEKENVFFSTVASRSQDYITSWLQSVDCPIIRLDGTLLPPEENVDYLVSALAIQS